jgi:hypothetical protein
MDVKITFLRCFHYTVQIQPYLVQVMYIWDNGGTIMGTISDCLHIKGSDQRENRLVWSSINTRYLVWGCGDGRSFVL